MDIIRTTGPKFWRLSYDIKDRKEKYHEVWRIWGLRLMQMILSLGSVFSIAYLHHVVYQDEKAMFLQYPTAEGLTPLIKRISTKVLIWLVFLSILSFLSVTGIILYLYSRWIRRQSRWIIMTSVYHAVISHVIIYLTVMGSHDLHVLNRKTRRMMAALYLAGAFGFLNSFVHIISVVYPTPLPTLIRGQRIFPSGDHPNIPQASRTHSSKSHHVDFPEQTGAEGTELGEPEQEASGVADPLAPHTGAV